MKCTRLIVLVLPMILGYTTASAQVKSAASEKIMKEAIIDAAGIHKNVFVIFHASWCGWCHKMDDAMSDEKLKSLFDSNYIIVHLTVDESGDKKDLENPGARELRKKYHGDQQGLPYWFILDSKGNFLADSRLKTGNLAGNKRRGNVGCPTRNDEVQYFINVIRKTSSLNDSQLTLIQKRFLNNR
ncbi:MAG: thioredoxin family protein [Ginsengibacter sp.]